MSEPAIRRRLVVHGRVQGVFFRDRTRECAQSVGVAGQARNLPDGTVEVVLEGPAEAVQRVISFCQRGPRDAHVEAVDVYDERPEGIEGFDLG